MCFVNYIFKEELIIVAAVSTNTSYNRLRIPASLSKTSSICSKKEQVTLNE